MEKVKLFEILQEKPYANSNIIFNSFIENNMTYMNSQYVLKNINDYRLLNMFRDDDNFVDNFIEFPLSFDIDIEEYSNNPDVEKLSTIDEILTLEKLNKFHMVNSEARKMVTAGSFADQFKYVPALS